MKRFMFILFALTVAIMSWEGQLTSANVKDNGPIPTESIRLRILANSDSVEDQLLKRKVRDAILAEMNTWAVNIASYEDARIIVAKHLPKMEKVVAETIKKHGFSYKAEVDFGQVEFPTKLYGSYVYPAGKYEALRVRIGEAKGQNWWCVLFPPLCFIDIASGDAVAKKQKSEQPVDKQEESLAPSQEDQTTRSKAEDNQKLSIQSVDNIEQPIEQPKVEIRSYIWDKLMSWF